MQNMIRVAILDDHLMMIKGYESSLSTAPHIVVAGTARFGEELFPMLADKPADLLILDVQVPTSETNRSPYPILAAIPKLVQTYPELHILVSSMHNERALIQAIMDNGARGYILKDDLKAMRDLETIITAIVYDDEIFLSDEAQYQIDKQREKKLVEQLLTPRQVIALSVCGAYPSISTAQLAERLNVASSTVRNLLSGAYIRLGVRNRNAAVERARQLGLISANSTPPAINDLQPTNETRPVN
jgi:DNA-binding NarL/FixJ family response regulator